MLRLSHSRRFFATQGKLFEKILIANRGEIAVRIIKTCQKLGIKTVAIYSEADVNSLHVQLADEAICVGGPLTNQSYLNIPNIMAAVKKCGAQAVHPGYGFLSENRHFQEALQNEGVTFIGPGTHAITVMSDKITSKQAAMAAKVNVIPGYTKPVTTEEEVLKIANQIGYPVMIKAAHGGGGKGMRAVYSDQEAKDGFRLSKAEALTSFGDDTMFIEKFIEEPRHIEIQILADKYGNAVYLNERECSVQRRNQKVIEEAPSIFLDPKTRQAMGEQAVSLAKATGYATAGTVEFLVDKNKNFYYLEMNTRLQVEHPVTEYITGLDLVEQMIRVASGEKLAFTQKDVGLKGWAVETRIYAEDPLRGFLPSIGRLTKYVEPRLDGNKPVSYFNCGKDLRIDSYIREGSQISIYYDPMIAKLVTYGPNRNEALDKMKEALDRFVIRGVTHNVNFLRSLCDHPRFREGRLSTKFIPEEYPEGYKGAVLGPHERRVLVAAAYAVYSQQVAQQLTISGQLDNFPLENVEASRISNMVATLKGDKEDNYLLNIERVSVNKDGKYPIDVTLEVAENGDKKQIRLQSDYRRGDLVFTCDCDGESSIFQVVKSSDDSTKLMLQYKGTYFQIGLLSADEQALSSYMLKPAVLNLDKFILSPMPGAIYSIKVQIGDQVVPGQEICVVEAMKMQNALRSNAAGKVKSINVKVGQNVASDQVLVEFE